jgi:hypothetical protein
MKTFLLLAVCIILSGCIKEQCWTCETTYHTTYSDGRPADESSIAQPVCNYTETEIEDYERSSSYTTTINSGGVVTVITTTTRCTR